MNLAAIQVALYAWAHAVVNGDLDEDDPGIMARVYWDNPALPRPANPSVRLKLIGGPTQVGLDEIRAPDDDGVAPLVGERTAILSVTAYGDTAQQIMSDLLTSVSMPDAVAVTDAAGVAFRTLGPVRDVSAILETKFEQRHQADFALGLTETKTTETGAIEYVEIESEVPESDGSGEHVGTITVGEEFTP